MAARANSPILIKKIKKVSGGGHHGGAWKVAYADFVTAMMAFFLLMWLINTTEPGTEEAASPTISPRPASPRRPPAPAASWAAPRSAMTVAKGSGSAVDHRGAGARSRRTAADGQEPGRQLKAEDTAASTDAMRCRPKCRSARKPPSPVRRPVPAPGACRTMPELAELSKTASSSTRRPKGLRIQLVDQEGRSHVRQQGSDPAPTPALKLLLRAVTKVINQLPNRITVSGHTSGHARVERRQRPDSDWALSSARADGFTQGAAKPPASTRTGSIQVVRQGQFRTAVSRTIPPCPAIAASPSCCCARPRSCLWTDHCASETAAAP